jgi:Ca-activated chloride channel family protein
MLTFLLLAALHVNTQVEHDFLPEQTGGEVYVQVDLAADAAREEGHRVPVNAVMILDRSGSMAGVKIERAREAARALVQALGPEDRFSIIDFSNQARVAVPCSAATLGAKADALAVIAAIHPGGGTNMSAAFDAAAPQLSEGRAHGRLDKVFVASDGQANQGIASRPALLALAQRDFGAATVSTFGIGEDYDEQFMTQLAVQAGGRARYVGAGADLPQAFASELSRAAQAVAHDVRLDVHPFKNVRVVHIVGYAGESVRLPDIAAGEERRVLVKLAAPPGRGTAELADIVLTYRDRHGAEQRARATAQAQYTADARKLESQKPNQITWQAAMGEMADGAKAALRYQAANEPELARKEQDRVAQIAAQAAAAAPAPTAKKLKERAESYDTRLSASGSGAQSERKALSADTAEEATAAVAF